MLKVNFSFFLTTDYNKRICWSFYQLTNRFSDQEYKILWKVLIRISFGLGYGINMMTKQPKKYLWIAWFRGLVQHIVSPDVSIRN